MGVPFYRVIMNENPKRTVSITKYWEVDRHFCGAQAIFGVRFTFHRCTAKTAA